MPLKKRARSGDGKRNTSKRSTRTATRVDDDDATASAQASVKISKCLRVEEEEDVDEDTTLEQLGRRFFHAKAVSFHPPLPAAATLAAAPAKPVFSLQVQGEDAGVKTTAVAAAAATPVKAEGGGPSLNPSGTGAAILPVTVASLHRETTSPANLTSSSGLAYSVLSPMKGAEVYASFRASACGHISVDADSIEEDNGSIKISPVLHRPTTLVRMVAATQPVISPATRWICIDDDDDDDGEIKFSSCQPSPSWRPLEGSIVPCPPENKVLQQPQSQQSFHPRREPIAEVLPPTFRPRKGPLQANKPPSRAFSPLLNGCVIYDDDFTSSEDNEDWAKNGKDESHQSKGNDASPPQCQGGYHLPLFSPSHLHTTMSMRSSAPLHITGKAFIVDDDNTTTTTSRGGSSSSRTSTNKKSHGAQFMEKQGEDAKREIKKSKNTVDGSKSTRPESENLQHSFAVTPLLLHDEETLLASIDTAVASPTRSVRDFLFPSRRRSSMDGADSSSLFMATATNSARAEADAQARGVRAVEQLRPLFPKRLTRKSFLSTAETVVSKTHCLEAGEFWQAFDHIEYVGEGSFGLVWRCRTLDGDLVAVKSCPISLHSRGSIDDAFSVLREIAVMRFLGEHEVPYVLPLHSAFFVQSREALPPDVVAALEWKARLAKAEEEERYQKQQQFGRKRKQANQKRVRKRVEETESETKREEAVVVAAAAASTKTPAVAVSAEEIAERMRNEKIRLPRFLSISVEDAMECDATAFLVTELCDGDLESIERHDGITKGVAFCVASALSAIHELGLVHLDLKPSNILFAYENGPSHQQRRLRQMQQQQQQNSLMICAAETPSTLSQEPSVEAAVARVTNVSMPSPVKFYLSDFGNCRIVGPDMADEVTGVFGTFEYMDCRALRDKTCSRATDCFSLGATLYELLYSRRLYASCKNPKCTSDEDHTRHCYVEAAMQPVTMAPTSPSAGILQKVTAGLLAQDQRERWTAERCRSFFLINDVAGAAAATLP